MRCPAHAKIETSEAFQEVLLLVDRIMSHGLSRVAIATDKAVNRMAPFNNETQLLKQCADAIVRRRQKIWRWNEHERCHVCSCGLAARAKGHEG